VEAALVGHEAVLEAAVVGHEDDNRLIKPKAFVVLKEGRSPSEALKATMQQHIKDRLAPYKYPRWIEFVNELPKTATGKIQRCKLDELEGATAHLEVEVLPEAMRKGVIQKRDAYERAVRGLVAEGIERGEFARTDPALVTRAMLGAVNWTARWYRPEGPRSVA